MSLIHVMEDDRRWSEDKCAYVLFLLRKCRKEKESKRCAVYEKALAEECPNSPLLPRRSECRSPSS